MLCQATTVCMYMIVFVGMCVSVSLGSFRSAFKTSPFTCVCMHVCMYAGMYVCVCDVYTYLHTHVSTCNCPEHV
jgi:hypothetical protein